MTLKKMKTGDKPVVIRTNRHGRLHLRGMNRADFVFAEALLSGPANPQKVMSELIHYQLVKPVLSSEIIDAWPARLQLRVGRLWLAHHNLPVAKEEINTHCTDAAGFIKIVREYIEEKKALHRQSQFTATNLSWLFDIVGHPYLDVMKGFTGKIVAQNTALVRGANFDSVSAFDGITAIDKAFNRPALNALRNFQIVKHSPHSVLPMFKDSLSPLLPAATRSSVTFNL